MLSHLLEATFFFGKWKKSFKMDIFDLNERKKERRKTKALHSMAPLASLTVWMD